MLSWQLQSKRFWKHAEKGLKAEEDSNLQAIVKSKKVAGIFGKCRLEYVEKQLKMVCCGVSQNIPEARFEAIQWEVDTAFLGILLMEVLLV